MTLSSLFCVLTKSKHAKIVVYKMAPVKSGSEETLFIK